MYVIERRRISKSYPYRWDRTFYVCESKRVEGKPKRVVVATFKNAYSLEAAVTNQQAEIKRFSEKMLLSAAAGVSKSAITASLQQLQQELAVLIDCKAKLPDWRAEPLGEPPMHLWPKRKPPRLHTVAVTVRVPPDCVEKLKSYAKLLR